MLILNNHDFVKVKDVKVGDKVCFELPSANYIVREITQTKIGMIRHRHDSGSSSYWPKELVYVEKRCNHKPKDWNRMGYISWEEWAEKQIKKGHAPRQCPKCKLWFFPSEF